MSVCAAAHIEESGSEMTARVAVSEDIPSKPTPFSSVANIAIYHQYGTIFFGTRVDSPGTTML